MGNCQVFSMTFCGNFNQVQAFNARTSFRGNLTLTLSPWRGEGTRCSAMLGELIRFMGGEQVRMERGTFRGLRTSFRGVFPINTTGFGRKKRGFKRTVLPGGRMPPSTSGKMPDTTRARTLHESEMGILIFNDLRYPVHSHPQRKKPGGWVNLPGFLEVESLIPR